MGVAKHDEKSSCDVVVSMDSIPGYPLPFADPLPADFVGEGVATGVLKWAGEELFLFSVPLSAGEAVASPDTSFPIVPNSSLDYPAITLTKSTIDSVLQSKRFRR